VTWRPLRGQRYLTPSHYDWATIITEKLPFYDFDEAEAFYASLNQGNVDERALALLGCNDRYFLFTRLLKRKDGMHPWLYERCREVEAQPDGYLDLWAREHYKSSVITFAGIIQEILTDPEMTVGIFSFTQGIARDFVKQIKFELETNDVLKHLYRDCLYEDPVKEAPIWTKDAFVIKRETNPKEATVEGWGLVTGMPTGRHFRLRVYDDVVTDSSVTNPEMVKKTTQAWELSDNLGGGERRVWHIGTRYSYADTYGVIFERNLLKERLFPATHNGRKDGIPVFMSPETWEKKKAIQASTLAAQMLQNPLAGNEQMFSAKWFRPYTARPKTLNVFIMGDPSKGTGKSSDRTAIAVVGIDSAGNKFLLDGVRHRMKMKERWETLRNLWLKWSRAPGVQCVEVGWERYGQQTDDEYFKEQMDREGFSFGLTELNWTREGKQSKKDRVERLEPDFRDGRLFLPAQIYVPATGVCLWSINEDRDHVETRSLVRREDPKDPKSRILSKTTREIERLQREGAGYLIAKPIIRKDEEGRLYDVTQSLMEECLFFPFAPKDDLVDALSRIYDMQARPPSIYEMPSALLQEEEESSTDALRSERFR
jgi:hypothetical protein